MRVGVPAGAGEGSSRKDEPVAGGVREVLRTAGG